MCRLVAPVSIVKHTVRVANGRTVGCLVYHSYGLAIRYVVAAVGLGLVNGEVVKLSITAVLAIDIESKQRMA